jgi:hypothetical protein
MTKPMSVAGAGAALGLLGAAGQLWLMHFGAAASAPLRTTLSMLIAVLIGVIAGTMARENAVKVAALMGVVAGAIMTIVGLAALLRNPELIGQNPFASAESFFYFVSSIMAGTVLTAWVIAGVAALVSWPIGLAQPQDEE